MATSSRGGKKSQARAEAGSAAAAAALPPLPPPPSRTPGRRPGPTRRTALSAEAIVAAAIEELDESGVAGLSMRRVAARLDTGPASLYAHVSSKAELLELIFDTLIGQVPLPEPDAARWREQLKEIMRGLRDILTSHRDAALAGLGRIPTSPQTLAGAETIVAIMRAGGLSDRTIALGLDQLILHVSATAFEAGLFEHSMTPDEFEQYYLEIHAFYEALPAERFPTLASIGPDMTGHDADERFEFGLEMLIGGLEAIDAKR